MCGRQKKNSFIGLIIDSLRLATLGMPLPVMVIRVSQVIHANDWGVPLCC